MSARRARPACRRSGARGREPPIEWVDGTWQAPERRGHELIWFPDPVGARECEVVAPGVELLRDSVPGLRRASVRVGDVPVRRAGVALLTRRPLDDGWGAARVEVWGWRGTARDAVVYGVIERPAVAAGTVLAVSAACLAGLLPAVDLRGEPLGARALGAVVDPAAFLGELARRGSESSGLRGSCRGVNLHRVSQAVFDALHDGLVIQDAGGAIVYANPAAERILGFPASELIGLTSKDPRWDAVDVHGAAISYDEHPIVTARITGRPVRGFLMGVRRADDELAWVEIDATPLIDDPDAPPVGSVAAFRDITDELGARRALRTSEERFRTAVETMMDGFMIWRAVRDAERGDRRLRLRVRQCRRRGVRVHPERARRRAAARLRS